MCRSVGVFKILRGYIIDLAEYGLCLFDTAVMCQIQHVCNESGADRALLRERERA
jgi:hypothetical protein